MIYQVAVEIDRGSDAGALTRCHLLIPDSAEAVCGFARSKLFVADWTWSQVSQLYRCHRCSVAAPEA